jgi:hypothetical protein
MTTAVETGQDIELVGWSGERYTGKIYTDKNSTSALSGRAIACLANSTQDEGEWTHNVNSIYNTENVTEELAHFRSRDDISHLILIPYNSIPLSGVGDKVDDLIRSYIHR